MAHGVVEPVSPVQIDYVEFQVTDIQAAKRFYGDLFGWTFEDYGDSYTGFNHGSGTGGFAKTEAVSRGGPLIVLYTDNLEAMQRNIVRAGAHLSPSCIQASISSSPGSGIWRTQWGGSEGSWPDSSASGWPACPLRSSTPSGRWGASSAKGGPADVLTSAVGASGIAVTATAVDESSGPSC